MNIQYKIGALTVASLLLCACGGSSSSSPAEESHEHSLMISQKDTDVLSVLEEGTAESLADAADANGAALLLSDSGEAAAIITAGGVQFVAAHHEEEGASDETHELPELITITKLNGITAQPVVVNTKGHFSVLADGSTLLVPYESLEEGATPEAEELSLSIATTETYPAFVLEEGALAIGFNGATVAAYEDSGSGFAPEGTSMVCETVNSAAHTTLVEDGIVVADFVVVSCDNSGTAKNYKVELIHDTDTLTISELSLTTPTLVDWKTRASVFVGKGADNRFYVAEEDHDTGALELVAAQGFAAPAGICTWGIDSEAADIFALTASELAVYSHEGSKDASLALDESPNATCDSLTLATASQAVFVVDNSASKLYEIDKEDGASLYHIHGRESVSVNDVAAAVSFHEVGTEGSHDH